MEHDSDKVIEVARRLMRSWPRRSSVHVTYLPGGYSNRNYRLDVDGARYALRIVTGDAPRRHEQRYLAIAAAPDVVGYDEQTGDMLTRWIDGQMLAANPIGPAEAGRYLAELHIQIPTGIRRYDYETEITALLANVAEPDAGVLARWSRLAWSATEHCGCHNDLNPWNVIRASGTANASPPTGTAWRTLDWEFAGDNDRLFDLVGLGLGLLWTDAELAACAASYQQTCAGTHALPDSTPQRLADTVCAYRIREYAWAAAQVAAGNDRPEIREQASRMRAAVLQGS